MPPRSKMRLLPLGALLRQAGCFRQFAVRRPQCGFPPLEVRVRERRPLRSTCQRDGLEAAGRDRGTVIVSSSRGLVSPALSSRGGEGEAARIVREMAMRIGTSDKSGFPVVVPGCAHVCWGGYSSIVAHPVQISLTPRFSGVSCACAGRKPFQRFPGLRGRNGPLNDPSSLSIADQEAPHLLVERYEHRWQADGNR